MRGAFTSLDIAITDIYPSRRTRRVREVMYVRRGREGPGHDPLVCTLVVLGWLVGARFARVRWLRAEAERQRLRAELRHAVRRG